MNSKPTIKPGLGVKAFPIIIPNKIAIKTVEIGLFEVPNNSIPITLLMPWQKILNMNAKIIPGIICFVLSVIIMRI